MLVMDLHRPTTYISILVLVAATGILAFLTLEGIIFRKNGIVSTEGERSGIHRYVVFMQFVINNAAVQFGSRL